MRKRQINGEQGKDEYEVDQEEEAREEEDEYKKEKK